MTDYSFISKRVRNKRKTQAFYWKIETKNSLSMEICRTRRWGGICLACVWPVNQSTRVFPNTPHLWHPLPLQAWWGGVHILCWSPSWLPYWEVILSFEQNTFSFESSVDQKAHVERTFCPWQAGNQTPSPWTWTVFPHLEASLILWF